MKDDIFIVPDYFTGTNAPEAHVRFYTTDKASFKNKVIFKQNLICFIIQGTKEIIAINASFKLDKTKILLLESGSVLASESLTENQKYESILFFFSNKFLAEFCIRHHIGLSKKVEKQQSCDAIHKDDYLRNFQSSISILRHKTPPDLFQLKLDELLLYLFHNYKKEFVALLNKTTFNTPDSIIRDVIATHSNDTLTVDELAFLCNMSISTFKRHFTAIFETSPKKYFTKNKMLRAKQLLSLRRSASEIYHDLGYESISSFSSEFKKHFGVSPTHFQKTNELRAKVFEPLA